MPSAFPARLTARLRRIAYCLLPLALGTGAALALLLAASNPARAGNANRPAGLLCGATIQACIDAASPGSTVFIPAGDYTESLTLSKAVSLTGALSSTTILHALPNTRVLTVTGAAVDSSVVISGLTFTGGNLTDTTGCPAGCGAGILITNLANPRLINSILTNNTAGAVGGGLYDDSGLAMSNVQFIDNTGGGAFTRGATTIQDSLFEGNQLGFSGFLAGGGLSVLYGNLVLTDSQFISNSAGEFGGGAAVFGGNTVQVQGGLFQGNQCGVGIGLHCGGGGLYAQNTLVLTGTQFISNTSGVSGGGAYADNGVLRGALFESNRCTQDPCFGGGLYGSGTQSSPLLTLIDTKFVSNSATFSGGGYVAGGQTTVQGGLFQGNVVSDTGGNGGGLVAYDALAVTGTLFIGNQSNGPGGGLAIESLVSARLVNALFAGNSAGAGAALVSSTPSSTVILHTTIASPTVGAGSAMVVTTGTVGITDTIIASYTTGISQTGGSVFQDYNLFFGNSTNITGAVSSGAHSFIGNPAFRDPAHDDYHITAGSTARGKGIDVGVTTDFEGDPRPSGGGFDIGFDQYNLKALFLPLVRR